MVKANKMERYTTDPTDKELIDAAGYHKSVHYIRDLVKGGSGSTEKPPAGFTPISGSKKGGYHMKRGKGFMYWYPGMGITSSAKGADADKKPGEGKPADGDGKPAGPAGGLDTTSGGRKVISDPSELPAGFNEMDKKQRAVLTADYPTVEQEMTERFGEPKSYKGELKQAITDHLKELSSHGYIIPSNLEKAEGMMHQMAEHGEAAGIDAGKLAAVMEENVRKLAHQEIEAARRTLGDHGVRHLSVNAQQSDAIFEQLKKGGVEIGAMDHFMAYQVWMDHDMGYTIPAIAKGGFAVKDNYHPQASAVMGFQQRDKFTEIFGKDGFDRYIQSIANHSGSEVDWKKDYFGSAVRLADNTHLFADKMPEVLFDSKEAVETMVKIRIAADHVKGSGKEGKRTPEEKAKFKALIAGVRAHLTKAIDARDNLPPESKAALAKAASEIGELTPKFLIGRLAGRSPKFDYNGTDMKVIIEQSEARNTIGQVFGMDDADKQFVKLLEDYGVTPDNALDKKPPPPGARIGDDDNGIEFSWTKPTNEHHVEQRHAATMKAAQGEWDEIGAMSDGEEKDSAINKFFGVDVAKSFAALMITADLDDWLKKSEESQPREARAKMYGNDETSKSIREGRGSAAGPRDTSGFGPRDGRGGQCAGRLEKDRSAEEISKLADAVMGGAKLDDVLEDLGDDKEKLLAELRTRQAKKAGVRKARVGIGDAFVELDADDAIAKSLDDGSLEIGVQGRHHAPAPDQMRKGTIYQGEAYDQPCPPEDQQRQHIAALIVEDDPTGFGGQGGLAEWWRDANTGKPDNGHPLAINVDPGPTKVIDDRDPMVRSSFTKRDY